MYWTHRQSVNLFGADANVSTMPRAMCGDTNSHKWTVSFNAPISAGAIATAYFDRPDGGAATAPCVVEEGCLSVFIPQVAIAVPGWVRCTMQVTDGDSITTAAYARLFVEPAVSGVLVEPGEAFPGLPVIASQVEDLANTVGAFPHIYFAETIEAMNAITGMRIGDICLIPEEAL